MKFIGFMKNGRGVMNEVDEPMGATATIELVKDLDGIQVIEVNVGEKKRPYKKKEKPEEPATAD